MSNSVTQYGAPAPQPRRRPRRRAKKIVTILVVLVGLLVAADFGLAAMAEHTVSQKARAQLDLSSDPKVAVHGFPFITQAISGEYDHISVQAKGVAVNETLQGVALKADLRDVSAPLSELLAGNVSNVTIGTLEGQVKLKESVIASIPPLTKIENLNIEPTTEEYVREGEEAKTDPQEARQREAEQQDAANEADSAGGDSTEQAGDGDESTTGIRISGNLRIAGEKVEIFAFAIIKLDGSTISIEPERLQFARAHETTVVPTAVQNRLLPSFQANINAADLPFTVTPTDITVTSGAVIIKGKADDVAFSELSIGSTG